VNENLPKNFPKVPDAVSFKLKGKDMNQEVMNISTEPLSLKKTAYSVRVSLAL